MNFNYFPLLHLDRPGRPETKVDQFGGEVDKPLLGILGFETPELVK